MRHVMEFYLAPLEGITGYIYRNAHRACYNDFDKYFTPFITTNQNGILRSRELNDVIPEHNKNMKVIPQLLTNKAAEFIELAKELKNFGYDELNLNFGCPSRTVTSKRKGAGFLADTCEMERFLDEIFSKQVTKISVKTRLGIEDAYEFEDIIKVYNRFPFEEVIIHPRVLKDYYNNHPDMDEFIKALGISTNSVCYNGDIYTVADYQRIIDSCPKLSKVMLGRGIIGNPALAGMIQGKEYDIKVLQLFLDKVYDGYKDIMPTDTNVLYKMKEIWCYLNRLFPDRTKEFKKIKKATSLKQYEEAVRFIYEEYSCGYSGTC